MEYVWPARRNRRKITATPDISLDDADDDPIYDSDPSESVTLPRRASVDTPHTLLRRHSQKKRVSGENASRLGTRQMTASRSFTDLRSSSRQNSRTNSSTMLSSGTSTADRSWLTDKSGYSEPAKMGEFGELLRRRSRELGDAAEMKSRSLQKHFVHVSIPRLVNLVQHSIPLTLYTA